MFIYNSKAKHQALKGFPCFSFSKLISAKVPFGMALAPAALAFSSASALDIWSISPVKHIVMPQLLRIGFQVSVNVFQCVQEDPQRFWSQSTNHLLNLQWLYNGKSFAKRTSKAKATIQRKSGLGIVDLFHQKKESFTFLW